MPRAFTLVLLAVAAAFAQPLTFEVASVKPASAGRGGATNDPLAYSAHGAQLKFLMAAAYEVPDFQISGGPAWVGTEPFDIDARSAKPATQSQKMEMLRALLAERFQLKFHREHTTLRAYVLVTGKDGPKIHPAPSDGPRPAGKPGWLALRINMKQLASILNVYIGQGRDFPAPGQPPLTPPDPLPVIDQTGLTGEYDVVLDLTHSRDWFVVLEQQLGLKLEPRKVATEMLIIDNVMKPLPN
jgi:uncharacterized protein (TIGR03435 family)